LQQLNDRSTGSHAGALGHRLASIEFAYSVSRSKMPAEQLAGFGALFVGAWF
jgi:hypothetical protein